MLVEEIKAAYRRKNKWRWKQSEIKDDFIEALIAAEVAAEKGLKIEIVWSGATPTDDRLKDILAGSPPTRAEEGYLAF